MNYIAKTEFDWEYYLSKNDDVKKKGINGLDECYRHWILYGCYENRIVKSLKSDQDLRNRP